MKLILYLNVKDMNVVLDVIQKNVVDANIINLKKILDKTVFIITYNKDGKIIDTDIKFIRNDQFINDRSR